MDSIGHWGELDTAIVVAIFVALIVAAIFGRKK
jgi:hypothetical protein